jgi:ribosomal protein L40E
MDQPEKESILVHKDVNHSLCVKCGFPNRPTDKNCQYCHTSIAQEPGLGAWLKQTFYVLRWRWQLNQKRDNLNKTSKSVFLKSLGYFLIGVVLSGIGIYIFTLSVAQNSFTNGLIAILFLLYGGFTLKTLFTK